MSELCLLTLCTSEFILSRRVFDYQEELLCCRVTVNLSVIPVLFACVFKFEIFISTCSMLLKEILLFTTVATKSAVTGKSVNHLVKYCGKSGLT